jgi:hypothetical protein
MIDPIVPIYMIAEFTINNNIETDKDSFELFAMWIGIIGGIIGIIASIATILAVIYGKQAIKQATKDTFNSLLKQQLIDATLLCSDAAEKCKLLKLKDVLIENHRINGDGAGIDKIVIECETIIHAIEADSMKIQSIVKVNNYGHKPHIQPLINDLILLTAAHNEFTKGIRTIFPLGSKEIDGRVHMNLLMPPYENFKNGLKEMTKGFVKFNQLSQHIENYVRDGFPNS